MANAACPLCGKEKERASHVVCNECYQIYTTQAGRSLAREGRVIPFTIWTKEEVEKRFQPLQTQLEDIRKKYDVLSKEVSEAAYQDITTKLGGKRVDPEVFRAALREKRDELWKQKGGGRLHWELKTLEKKVEFLGGMLAELTAKVEQMEKEVPVESSSLEEELKELLKEPPKSEMPENPQEAESPEDPPAPNRVPKTKGGRTGEKAQLRQMAESGQFDDEN